MLFAFKRTNFSSFISNRALFYGIVILFVAISTAKTEDYVKLIEDAIDALPRRNHEIVPFLLQEVNFVNGFTQYKWPGTGVQAFTRHTLDNHLSHLIFPTGEYFGPKINGSYIVLRRHPGNDTVYYLSAVYIRSEGPGLRVEWTPGDIWAKKKSKGEYDLCQAKVCGIPEMLLGTCSIVKRKCTKDDAPFTSETSYETFLKKEEGVGPLGDQLGLYNKTSGSESPSEIDSSVQPTKSRKKRMMMSYDYYKNYSSYLRNSSRRTQGKFERLELRVPTSFDLLEMLAESGENGTMEFMFKNRIDRRKKRKSEELGRGDVEEVLHTLTCIDCHRVGDFFEDLEENSVYSQVLGAGIRGMVKKGGIGVESSGNRRSDDGNDNVDSKSKSQPTPPPFIGYGNCPYEIKGRDRPVSQEVDDIIDFYLRALKVDCDIHEGMVETVRGWFTGEVKFLEILPDLTVQIWPGSPFLKYHMLSTSEHETLISGLLFSKFTSVYMEETLLNGGKKDEFHGSTNNLTISKEIKFLSRVFLESLETTRSYLSHHLIKLTRSLARLLKNKFLALLVLSQNEEGRGESHPGRRHLNSENVRGQENEANYNDRQQVLALKEFILYGLRPVLRSATTAPQAFLSFYTLNANRIKLLVDMYDINLEK